MDTRLLSLFFVANILLVLTPGPDWIYVMTRGVAGGRRSALVSVGGVCAGYFSHAVLAALGLAALLQSSGVAFEIVRYAGAAYLVYLGVRMLLSKSIGFEPREDGAVDTEPTLAVLRQGFLTAFLNPKGLLVFLSLLPQFVATSAVLPVAIQLLLLGLIHTINCVVIYGVVGLTAGGLGEQLRRRLRLAKIIRWLAGSVLIALGLRLAFPGQR